MRNITNQFEFDVQKMLANRLRNTHYCFGNVSFLHNESDFLTISENGMVTDFEIKRSKSDFLNDFKKPRHQFMLDTYIKKDCKGILGRVANRFYFVIPTDLKDKIIHVLPKYAGLIIYDDAGPKTLIKAPLLHTELHPIQWLMNPNYYMYQRFNIRPITNYPKHIVL